MFKHIKKKRREQNKKFETNGYDGGYGRIVIISSVWK